MSPSAPPAKRSPRIAIFVVAYNAESTLASVLDRIPEPVWTQVEEVFVCDDSSRDDTYDVGVGYKAQSGRSNLRMFRHEKNLGYGGNQIFGYQYAIERGFDIVVLLHGDGQYAPEVLPQLLEPLLRGEADAVFGSRMAVAGAALKGGMPLYKYVGNRILTVFENAALGMNLTEFHSGYRLYSVAALKEIPFAENTHDFHFDTQIIIQLHGAGKRIVEVPIPTYYGDEICHVNGMKYARDVFRSVIDSRLHQMGLAHFPRYQLGPRYSLKHSRTSSHGKLLDWVGTERKRVLDVGCGSGELSQQLVERGHDVVSVDFERPAVALPNFVQADIRAGLPSLDGRVFDCIVVADVLEHLAEPEPLLTSLAARLELGGRVMISLPNAVHWSVRAQILAGRFEYGERGLLDRGHLRFFTRASARRLCEEAGYRLVREEATPVPWERVLPASAASTVERVDDVLARLRPELFGYQILLELEPSGV